VKSTKSAISKPDKPYPDFPLFPHDTKRWAKKIKGRFHYFGPWSDWKAAFENYQHAMPYLLAGKPVPPKDLDVLTVGDMCNSFLAYKESQVSSGELEQRSWNDLKRSCEILIKHVGRHAAVEHMAPSDFAKLRSNLAAGVNLVSLANEVRRIRSIFNYAVKNCLVDRVQFGTSFDQPGTKAIRKERQSKPEKLFSVDELVTLYNAASPRMRCFMLLALNGGLGPGDIGQIERKHIQGNWVKYPRPKTTIDREFPLWKETLAAINREQQTEYDSELLFVTKYGQSWYKDGQADSPITKEFSKLLKECALQQKGRGFYALRHTFRTIADGCRDQVAIGICMGHCDSSMAGNYRHGIEPERLQAVVDHVRAKLAPMFAPAKPVKKSKGGV
jgi:integrase